MKKLHQNEMRKIRGGDAEEELQCLKGCNRAYVACLPLAAAAVCENNRNACRLRCLGCNPICP